MRGCPRQTGARHIFFLFLSNLAELCYNIVKGRREVAPQRTQGERWITQ